MSDDAVLAAAGVVDVEATGRKLTVYGVPLFSSFLRRCIRGGPVFLFAFCCRELRRAMRGYIGEEQCKYHL